MKLSLPSVARIAEEINADNPCDGSAVGLCKLNVSLKALKTKEASLKTVGYTHIYSVSYNICF